MSTGAKIGITLSELCGLGTLAMLFYYLSITGAAEQADSWSTGRVAAYTLLAAALLLIFVPFSLALKMGPVWLLAAGSWGLLGYVLLFVPAPDRAGAGFLTYVVFLMLVFVAVGSALSIPLAAMGKRILTRGSALHDMVRSLRQGALLSLFLVALLAMSPLGVLNWLNALLVLTTVSLTEFFFLARD